MPSLPKINQLLKAHYDALKKGKHVVMCCTRCDHSIQNPKDSLLCYEVEDINFTCNRCLMGMNAIRCVDCARFYIEDFPDQTQCKTCLAKDKEKCRDCGSWHSPHSLILKHCSSCIRKSRQPGHHFFHSLIKYIGHEEHNTFEEMKFKRCYGVELESSTTGVDYNQTNFSAVRDGSIEGQEFVSPILKGDMGLAAIKSLCALSPEFSNRCGFHLHLDATDLRWWDIISIGRGYTKLQPILFAMIHKNRRGSKYCKPITTPYFTMPRKGHMVRLIYGDKARLERRTKYSEKRYEFLNAHAYFYHKTLEIRLHEATFNFQDIKNWIILHQHLFDYFIKNITDASANPFEIITKALPAHLVDYCRTRVIKFNGHTPMVDYIRDPDSYRAITIQASMPKKLDSIKKKEFFFTKPPEPMKEQEQIFDSPTTPAGYLNSLSRRNFSQEMPNVPAPNSYEEVRERLRETVVRQELMSLQQRENSLAAISPQNQGSASELLSIRRRIHDLEQRRR